MVDKRQIEDLVSKLDHFMADGGGHMNVSADVLQRAEVAVSRSPYQKCSTGRYATACAVPTLMEGLDRDEE